MKYFLSFQKLKANNKTKFRFKIILWILPQKTFGGKLEVRKPEPSSSKLKKMQKFGALYQLLEHGNPIPFSKANSKIFVSGFCTV